MPDSYTQFLNLVKPEVGGSRDSWGDKLDANFDALDGWAKTTDALAKDALPRTALNKDANQAVIPWTVAGAVTFGAAVKAATLDVTGAMTGGQSIVLTRSDAAPYYDLNYPTKGRWRQTVDASGNLSLLTGDTPAVVAYFTPGGALWLQNLGATVSDRIEARAKFYADDRLATARAEYGQAFQKTGGVLTGGVSIEFGAAYLDIRNTNTGGIRWRMIGDTQGNLIFRDGDSADNKVYFTTGGNIWMKPFGDLASRIEARGAAYADDRLSTARADVNRKSTRLVFVGDAGMSGSNMYDTAGPGCVVTGFQ